MIIIENRPNCSIELATKEESIDNARDTDCVNSMCNMGCIDTPFLPVEEVVSHFKNDRLLRLKAMQEVENSTMAEMDSARLTSSDCEPTIKDRTVALIRGLDLILLHHDAGKAVRADLRMQLSAFLDDSESEKVWLKRCKSVLTVPLARYLRNEIPPPADKVFKPTGLLHQWMRSRLHSYNRKNTHLWYSWFQAKRATLPLSACIVQETYKEHLATLTKPDLGCKDTIQAIFEDKTFSNLMQSLRDAITHTYRTTRSFENSVPSGSACFTASRKMKGQFGHLCTEVSLAGECVTDSELDTMRDISCHVLYGHCVLETRVYFGREQWSLLPGILSHRYTPLNMKQRLRCTIQAVLEPNKIRVISKGEALEYYGMKPLQRAIHGSLRNLDPFRLIGRPLCPTDLIDLAEKAEPNYKWFSVDYSAATDGISWRYTKRILKYLISNLDADSRDLAMKVLGPHDLYYPSTEEESATDDPASPAYMTLPGTPIMKGVQTNGQLMGSILSFPILCLANLGVYLLTTQRMQASWSDKERLRHVLVNGDDMVYAAPLDLWETHVKIGKSVGLNMSVGKAYQHSSYLNINSTSIVYDLTRAHAEVQKSTPYQIDYLNVGLFFGQHKVQGRTEAREHSKSKDGIVDNINTLIQGSLPGRQCSLLGRLLSEQSEAIKADCKCTLVDERSRVKMHYRNLFISKAMGGMGVWCPPGFSFRTTKTDKYIMSFIRSQYTLPKFRYQRPLPGFDVTDLDTKGSQPWVRDVKEKDVVQFREKDATGQRALGVTTPIEFSESRYAHSGKLAEGCDGGGTFVRDYCEVFISQIDQIFRPKKNRRHIEEKDSE